MNRFQKLVSWFSSVWVRFPGHASQQSLTHKYGKSNKQKKKKLTKKKKKTVCVILRVLNLFIA